MIALYTRYMRHGPWAKVHFVGAPRSAQLAGRAITGKEPSISERTVSGPWPTPGRERAIADWVTAQCQRSRDGLPSSWTRGERALRNWNPTNIRTLRRSL
jgi:hypothetical protein